ncbi:unnamed protein product [Amaranthus hypochondriacus]
MFYSHTFLARKGPLGTVWCAAHLQHKLKKSHYASTDIPSTVERIIYPEVPIALRMSGHLLLGVVRIYSKKVEYLYKDYEGLRVSLQNAFCTVHVNLNENANQAQFNAITLPETYSLDAIEIDDDISRFDGSQDDHIRNIEEITLQDSTPVETELYVRITFDDDIIPDSSQSEPRESDPMQIDNPPAFPIPLSPDMQTAGVNQDEEFPPHEIMRDNRDFDAILSTPILRPHQDPVDPESNISPPKDTLEMEIDTPQSLPASTGVNSQQPLQHEGPSSPPTLDAREVSDTLVNVSPTQLVLRPSPSPEKPKPKRQRRKRKMCFDETLVLTNQFLKNSLNNCSDLVMKRRRLDSSALEQWRIKRKKNEDIFSKPLISGMCENLQNLLSEDLIVSNAKLAFTVATQPESRAAESPAHDPDAGGETQRHISGDDLEIERLRSVHDDPGQTIMETFPSSTPLPSPQPHGFVETPSSMRAPSSVSEPRFDDTDLQSDKGLFTSSTGFDMETPVFNTEERNEEMGTGLSDIPELRDSMMADELSFLEQDYESPTDSQGARTGDAMSARTRAVAQYLENHSPLSKYPSEELSLNSILEGKRRKICARMFYETLVLKSAGRIDVKQDEPYGDITLKLTAKI